MEWANLSPSDVTKMVLQVGVLPIVVLYFAWVITGSLRQEVHETLAIVQRESSNTEDLKRLLQEQTQQNQMLIDIQRQLCLNAADDYLKRAACWNPLRGQ